MKQLTQALALFLLVIAGTAATNPGARFDELGHKLICSCGCGQVLLECNHYGCPSLTQMKAELNAGIAKGDTDSVILSAFEQEYGPTVFAAPIRGGFDRVAWITPIIVFAGATLLAVFIIRRWRLRPATAAPATAAVSAPPSDAMRDRIRRETEEL